jgi:hypothetical protein
MKGAGAISKARPKREISARGFNTQKACKGLIFRFCNRSDNLHCNLYRDLFHYEEPWSACISSRSKSLLLRVNQGELYAHEFKAGL